MTYVYYTGDVISYVLGYPYILFFIYEDLLGSFLISNGVCGFSIWKFECCTDYGVLIGKVLIEMLLDTVHLTWHQEAVDHVVLRKIHSIDILFLELNIL